MQVKITHHASSTEGNTINLYDFIFEKLLSAEATDPGAVAINI